MPRAAARTVLSLAWVFMAWLALAVAALTVRYVLSLEYDPFFHDHYVTILPLVLTHGLAGAALLALGPVQFWPAARARWPHVHRDVGRLYLGALWIAGFAGFLMSTMALGGWIVRAGSCTLAVLWVFTAAMGMREARSGHFSSHRLWMMRNFGLTLSVITCRFSLMIFQDLGWTIDELAPWIAWLSWIPNLMLAELLARLHIQPPEG